MTTNQNNQTLYNKWERTWAKNKSHNMTALGKRINKKKQEGLRKILSGLEIKSIIDVGCGLGYSLEVFKSMGFDASGIDISQTAVDVCRKKGLPVKYGKLEEIKEEYDLVFSDGLLEHFIDFEKYVSHLARISKKYVIIIQTDHESAMTRFLLFLEALLRPGENMYEYNFRMCDYREAFKRVGFQQINEKKMLFSAFKILLFEIS